MAAPDSELRCCGQRLRLIVRFPAEPVQIAFVTFRPSPLRLRVIPIQYSFDARRAAAYPHRRVDNFAAEEFQAGTGSKRGRVCTKSTVIVTSPDRGLYTPMVAHQSATRPNAAFH